MKKQPRKARGKLLTGDSRKPGRIARLAYLTAAAKAGEAGLAEAGVRPAMLLNDAVKVNQ